MKDNDEVRKKNYGDQRNFGKGLEKEIKKKKRENGKKIIKTKIHKLTKIIVVGLGTCAQEESLWKSHEQKIPL